MTLYFTVQNHKFTVGYEWDATLTSYPIQFIYFEGRRVGLYDINNDNDTIYFDTVTMFELFGQEFNVNNFGIGITFGLFNRTGLTHEECNEKQNAINITLKGADDVFQCYLTKDLENKSMKSMKSIEKETMTVESL